MAQASAVMTVGGAQRVVFHDQQESRQTSGRGDSEGSQPCSVLSAPNLEEPPSDTTDGHLALVYPPSSTTGICLVYPHHHHFLPFQQQRLPAPFHPNCARLDQLLQMPFM